MHEQGPWIRIAVAAGTSVAAHMVLIGVALAVTGPAGWGIEEQPEPIEIDILTNPEPREPEEERVVAPERSIQPSPELERDPVRTREPQHVPSNREVDAPAPMVEAPSVMAPDVRVEEPSNRDPEQDRRRLGVLLNPSNVAINSFRLEGPGPGPSMPGPPAGLGTSHGRSEAEIERDLRNSLRAQAGTKAHITRERLDVQRRADGTYVHSGHRFTAVIQRNGEVVFQHRPDVQDTGRIEAAGRFDLGDMAMRASGQNPHRAEEERFMRDTEELRMRLEREFQAEQMERALRALRGRLARVWATSDRTAEARRRRIFGIWDDVDDGEAGREARAIIIGFIQDTIPSGSEDAYTSDELTRFNASRVSREEFRPY
jgi:hypothetical protein